MKLAENVALLLVDIQQGFDDMDYWGGNRNNPDAEKMAGQLLELWRQKGLPIFHVKHNSTTPASPLVKGKPGNAIQSVVQPLENEPLIEKDVNSAFIGTDLEDRLKSQGINQLVIVGMTTDHCISTTVRMAGNLGFDTYFVEDAIATFDKVSADGKKYPAQLVHELALASLNGEFAEQVTVADVVKELS